MFTVISGILILGLACAYVSGNESEQFQIFQPQFNTRPLKTNRIKRFCPKNVCTDSDREGEGVANMQCMLSSCVKRALQDDVGPFWANRGKKDPTYRHEPLYAEEPRWILVRRGQDHITPLTYDFEPFFVTRGKKDKQEEEDKDTVQAIYAKMHVRNRHNYGLRTNE